MMGFAVILLPQKIRAMKKIRPLTFTFKDDGTIPNSVLPLLVYKQVFSERGTVAANWLDDLFRTNGWSNSWRWGVYPYHHYHSNTHEVLGCFNGDALLQMGGEDGEEIAVQAGDIIVIPAGVGHKCLSHSGDFTVLGAYPDGASPDLMTGKADERPAADKRINKVAIPKLDPYAGSAEGLVTLWQR